MIDLDAPAVRRAARAAALTPAVLLTVAAAPALAAPPEQWEPAAPVSAFDFLLVLVLFPLALFVVISLLVLVPSFARGDKHAPGQAWRNENEWFGGPRAGVEAADEAPPAELEGDESTRGGASARW